MGQCKDSYISCILPSGFAILRVSPGNRKAGMPRISGSKKRRNPEKFPGKEHMSVRKELKQKGKQSLKKHYLIFAAVCLISAFLASEFKGSLSFSTLQSFDQVLELPAESMVPRRNVGWEEILEESPAFMRTRGVLSDVLNQATSDSILVTAAVSVNSLAGTENTEIFCLILAGAIGLFAFWFFIQNTFSVILRRIFLEGHTYERVPISRFLYLLRIKKWLRTSWIMLVKYLYHAFWSLTIIGGVIKHYSYFLVPYIAAENPDITARQAITLSRKMMKGHKWECFLFELSFLGWNLLGALTLGICSIFFTNPYKTAVFTEYYIRLRHAAKEAQLSNTDLLNDDYLYEKADPLILMEKYLDILDIMETPAPACPEIPCFRGFLARNLGILLFWGKQEKEYERFQGLQVKNRELSEALNGQVYPTRLYPIPQEKRRGQIESLHFMRQYTIWSLIVLFLGLPFLGWLWEVTLTLITDGEFINRGALNGPWLPIYGSGSILILTLLYRFRKNPLAEFFAAVLLCGFLEYLASLTLEITSGGMKWWDYSGYFLNLHGRTSAESLLVFGVGGLTVVYILAPLVDNLLHKADQKLLKLICLILLTLFCLDLVYSQVQPNAGEGITAMAETKNLLMQFRY